MKLMKKLIAILIITTLCLPFTYTVSATNISSENSWDLPENQYNKLHFYFLDSDYSTIDSGEEMVAAFSSLESIPIQSSTPSAEQPLNVTIQFTSNFSTTSQFLELASERSELKNIEEIHEWRKELNSFSELYHENLIASNLANLTELEYSEVSPIKYSPFVTFKMLPSDIHLENFSDLIENESISHISFDYVQETVSEMSWNNVLDTINATDIVEDQIYTGAGIRIGILEASGRCDDTHDTLSGIDITYNNDGTRPIEEQNISDHATKVTSILYTIAPDAEYYYDITANSADLSWFIDQYCDIINCSWGYTSAIKIADGQYAGATSNTYKMHQDGLYDYLVSTHFITVVKSAGNVNLNSTKSSYNPNALITNPGYAYNVITVGGVDFQSSNNPRLVHATLAAYESGSDSVKPNISAPFTVDIPGIGVDQGTSLSTPQVAASLALLYEAVPRLDSYPEIAMVLVTASAQETYDYSNDDGYIDEQVGTGVLNVSGMFDIAENGDYEDDATFGNQSEIFSIDIYLNEGDILQASTTWLVRIVVDEDGDPSEMYFTDYDLVIQDENQILLDSSVLWSNSNVEFIRYEAEADGLYTIVVDLWGDFNYGGSDTDFLAIAYSIK